MTAPAIILSHPQMGENIGAAARAMKNFGLSDLRLIAPQCGWPNERAKVAGGRARATSSNGREVFATAAEALADIRLVFATTARDRDVAARNPHARRRRPGGCATAGARRACHRHPVRRRAGRAGQ